MPEKITNSELAALVGRRVIYNPFDSLPMVHVGTIIEAKRGKFGVQVRVEPDYKSNMSLLTRWRSLKHDITRIMGGALVA